MVLPAGEVSPYKMAPTPNTATLGWPKCNTAPTYESERWQRESTVLRIVFLKRFENGYLGRSTKSWQMMVARVQRWEEIQHPRNVKMNFFLKSQCHVEITQQQKNKQIQQILTNFSHFSHFSLTPTKKNGPFEWEWWCFFLFPPSD